MREKYETMNNSELRRKNVIIGDYMQNTKYDDRETRCILLWSSKFFEHFNDIMRTYDLNRILYQTKWTRKYIKELLCYFKKISKTKAYLQESRITRLYRGLKRTELQRIQNDTIFLFDYCNL